MMRQARRGFTLIEMIVVMTIIAIAATLVAPNMLMNLNLVKPPNTTSILVKLFHDAHQFAINHDATLTLELDPKTGHFRADTTGVGGTGPVIEDSLQLGVSVTLETAQPRLRYTFFSSGAAFGDSVTVRGSDSTRAIFIDKWSGNAYTVPR